MFINIGYENFINTELVVIILNPDSAHVKKLRQEAIQKGSLINATSGHKTRSVIVLKEMQIVLSALQVTTLRARVNAAILNKHTEPSDVERYY